MFHIEFLINNDERRLDYKDAAAYVATQQLEVPDVEDYYKLTKVVIDGKEYTQWVGKTTGELFNYYLVNK